MAYKQRLTIIADVYWLKLSYYILFYSLFVKLLALALTNLVLILVNLVTNLAKPSLGQPSHKSDQT